MPISYVVFFINSMNNKIKKDLLKAFERDQKMRKQSFSSNKKWKDNVDIFNVELLLDIIEKIGWPTITKVGKDAAVAAMVLAIHADVRPDDQKLFLKLIEDNLDDVPKHLYANIYDRVLLRDKGYQKYGTQVFLNTHNEYEPYKIEEFTKVNKYRKELGLIPLEEYLESFKINLDEISN